MRQFIVEGEPGMFPPGVLWLWRKVGFGRPRRKPEPTPLPSPPTKPGSDGAAPPIDE